MIELPVQKVTFPIVDPIELKMFRTGTKKIQGVPKFTPFNIDALCLRRSPIIEAQKKKQSHPTLNHIGLIHANQYSEEDTNPSKDTFSFKETMKSPYKA